MINLYHGKNTYSSKQKADDAVHTARAKLDEAGTPYEFRIFDASTTPADTIIDEIETPSLLARHKVILIKRLAQNPQKDRLQTCVTALVSAPVASSDVDVVIWEDAKLSANLIYVKTFKKFNVIDESPQLNKRQFSTWAQSLATAQHVQMPSYVVHLLSNRVNYDPERFTTELTKLKLLGKDSFSEMDIETTCPDTLENTIWELIDSINDEDLPTAERTLERILRQGNDPQFVLLMIARNIRIILLTKLLLEKGYSSVDIARKIKVPPFTIMSLQRKARQTTVDRLTRMYDKLSNIDYSGKTGQLDIALALNILLSVI